MPNVLSFGEILWDLFPDYKKPGGSPANLAYHLHVLGNKTDLISAVGDDENGHELLDFIKTKRLPTNHIQILPEQPTGTVDVVFHDGEPSYTINEPAAWDYIESSQGLNELVKSADAICYASLSQRSEVSEQTLLKILETTKASALKVFDLNLREPFINKEAIINQINSSDVIKFNEDELKKVSSWFNTEDLPGYLIEKNPNVCLLITLGAKGSTLINTSGSYSQKAFPITGEGDFVGVGDAFLACATHLLLKQRSSNEVLLKANRYAGFIASQKGGMPDVPDNIIEAVNS